MQVLTRNLQATKEVDPALLVLEQRREKAEDAEAKAELSAAIEEHLKDERRPAIRVGFVLPDQRLRITQDYMRVSRKIKALSDAVDAGEVLTDEHVEESMRLDSDMRRISRLLCAYGVKGWKLEDEDGQEVVEGIERTVRKVVAAETIDADLRGVEPEKAPQPGDPLGEALRVLRRRPDLHHRVMEHLLHHVPRQAADRLVVFFAESPERALQLFLADRFELAAQVGIRLVVRLDHRKAPGPFQANNPEQLGKIFLGFPVQLF